MLRLLHWCNILWMICLAIKFSVLIIGCSLFNYISFSPFVGTKGEKEISLMRKYRIISTEDFRASPHPFANKQKAIDYTKHSPASNASKPQQGR